MRVGPPCRGRDKAVFFLRDPKGEAHARRMLGELGCSDEELQEFFADE